MNTIEQKYAAWAAVFMAISVMLGALGAHALQAVLDPSQLESFNTGVRYQAWHAISLLIVQLLPDTAVSQQSKVWVSRLMVAGIICFSFSIYLLNMRSMLGIEAAVKVFGPVTPIGGLLFIAAWLLLAVALFRSLSVRNTL